MANFPKAAATAKKLIEANGRAVDLIRLNRTADDSAKPWRGTSTAPDAGEGGLEIPGVIVAMVPATGSGFGRLLADEGGSLKVAYEQVGLLATDSVVAAGFTADDVEGCDLLRDGTKVWKIVTRGHLRPADRSVLFVLGLTS